MIFTSGVFDERRKLDAQDYQRIQYQYQVGYTIRMIANEHGISTKYVHKLLTNDPEAPQDLKWLSHNCSGCGRAFNWSGLSWHYEFWTSGNNPLACMTVMLHG